MDIIIRIFYIGTKIFTYAYIDIYALSLIHSSILLLYLSIRQNDGVAKWYKFDDGDVTECKMEEEEEMKSQCFGGDYLGEVFDHMLKRMSYRKQKRWWNAYMLFYTRLDVEENSLMKSVNELSLCKYCLKFIFIRKLYLFIINML